MKIELNWIENIYVMFGWMNSWVPKSVSRYLLDNIIDVNVHIYVTERLMRKESSLSCLSSLIFSFMEQDH